MMSIKVSTGLKQSKSKQDLDPVVQWSPDKNRVAVMVADGHGGRETKDKLQDPMNAEKILQCALDKSPADAMELAQQLTKNSNLADGAALSLMVVDVRSDIIRYCTRGDAQLVLLKMRDDSDAEFIQASKTHKFEDFDEKAWRPFLKKRGCHITEEVTTTWKPDVTGKQLDVTSKGVVHRFEFLGTSDVNMFGYVGHGGASDIVPSVNDQTDPLRKLSKGVTYRLVACSDGVWDVVNHADKMLGKVADAEELVSQTRKRWDGKWDIMCDDGRMYHDVWPDMAQGRPLDADDISAAIITWTCQGQNDAHRQDSKKSPPRWCQLNKGFCEEVAKNSVEVNLFQTMNNASPAAANTRNKHSKLTFKYMANLAISLCEKAINMTLIYFVRIVTQS